MSSNPRPNQILRHAALALTGLLGSACSDDADSGDATNAQAQDAAVAGHQASGGTGDSAGKGGAGGAGAGGAGAKGGAGGQAGSAGSAADDAPHKVTIHFKAVVADRDFSCLDRYENMGSSHVAAVPADFRFYVQDLELIDANDKEVAVKLEKRAPWQSEDVALIDFEDLQGHCHGTAETNTTITGSVPAGEYKGVVFSNGVPEALNHLDQSTQQPPLDVTDLYWTWLSGYRFVVAELAQDAADSGDAAAADDAGLALPGLGLMHVGSTACRKDQGCTKQNRNLIRLTNFDPEKDVIVADLAAVFVGTDLSKDQQCHAADPVCDSMFKQVGVSYETGGSLDQQKFYHVEQGGK